MDKHPFELHCISCVQCKSVNINSPSTLINCCYEGASMLRDYLHFMEESKHKKEIAQLKRQFAQNINGKSTIVSKKKLKEVMKYK